MELQKNTTGVTSIEFDTGTGYQQELKRTLTVYDLIVFGLIVMLPIAPIQVYGIVASISSGMAPLVYLVGIITMIFTAISYARMSREFPVAGSIYSFVQRGLNPHIGFVVGWTITIDYVLAPALLCAFAALWMQGVAPSVPSYAWVAVFIIIITYINVRGVQLSANTNTGMLIVELLTIVLFLGFAVKYVFIDGLGAGGFSLKPFYQPGQINLQFIASATSIAVFGFLGFDCISTLSEEVKNPRKSVGQATILALILIGVVFMAQSYMAALIHPAHTDLNPDMAFFDIAKQAGGNFMYYVLILVGVVAVGIANALAIQLSSSRLLYSLARDKMIPFSGIFGKVHPKFQTPANATIFTAVLTIFVAMMPITTIVKFINFGALTSFMCINIVVFYHFYLKKKDRGIVGFFKNLLVPLVGFLIIFYVWQGLGASTFILGFSWMAIGVVIGFIKSKGYKEVPPVLKDL